MNVSGAEAVVAAASPFVGQGESACLVKPYADRNAFCLFIFRVY
jgi:concentrative nucleoside transporter, CNT family